MICDEIALNSIEPGKWSMNESRFICDGRTEIACSRVSSGTVACKRPAAGRVLRQSGERNSAHQNFVLQKGGLTSLNLPFDSENGANVCEVSDK
jgi:hypothetical protein